jgi:two-component system response regulator AtoC
VEKAEIGMSHLVLVVDDDASMCELLAEGLDPAKFEVVWTTDPHTVEELLEKRQFDVVLTDVRMRGMDGLELCSRLVQRYRGLPVVVMTAFGSIDAAVNAMRAGAYDFLTKPLDVELAGVTLERAVSNGALRREVAELRRAVAASQGYGELIGASPAMRAVYEIVERAAPSEASVLISGESGTGKEVLARTLTAKSARASAPFIAVNCAAIPEALLESELFGHTKGAFTDARASREGLIARASGGTLFLDEVGDMPLGLQPKLLRVLQERVLRPVGSDREVPVDVRLICATNRDLETAIEERRFRADLYYRINVIHVALPPLRTRGADVLLLANHFLQRFTERSRHETCELSQEAERCLMTYPWPGNVRELANCMEHAAVLARGNRVEKGDLPEKVREVQRTEGLAVVHDPAELMSLEEVERRYILRVFEAVHGNKSQAALVLGLDRKTLYRRLERYGIRSEAAAASAAAAANAANANANPAVGTR